MFPFVADFVEYTKPHVSLDNNVYIIFLLAEVSYGI